MYADVFKKFSYYIQEVCSNIEEMHSIMQEVRSDIQEDHCEPSGPSYYLQTLSIFYHLGSYTVDHVAFTGEDTKWRCE